MKARRRRGTRDYGLELRVRQQVQAVPRRLRPGLLRWLRRQGRRPERVFWALDLRTGNWRRV
jgi:hypothetical protein